MALSRRPWCPLSVAVYKFDETQTAGQATGVLRMKRRTRVQFTDSHKGLMWGRWQQELRGSVIYA